MENSSYPTFTLGKALPHRKVHSSASAHTTAGCVNLFVFVSINPPTRQTGSLPGKSPALMSFIFLLYILSDHIPDFLPALFRLCRKGQYRHIRSRSQRLADHLQMFGNLAALQLVRFRGNDDRRKTVVTDPVIHGPVVPGRLMTNINQQE